ncbi:hypothetical protein ACFLYP_04275 [Chloroflexota bacterium]
MINWLSGFIDQLSNYFAERKGLLPIIGLLCVLLNLILKFIPGMEFISDSDIFLHIGVILSVFGLLLARAL